MYVGGMAGIFGHPILWQGLSRLAEAVRKGGTVLAEHAETPQHAFWETFARASSSIAFASSAALDQIIGGWIAERPRVRILDVAAGSGIYGFSLLARHPNAELCALDWPNVLTETRGWAERLGIDAGRVRYLEGSLFEVDYGGPYDLVLLSHIYHHFDAETCQRLTDKVARSLAAGGRVVVNDFLSDGDNPAAALFAITMLGWTRKGQVYPAAEIGAWLTRSGLSEPSVHPNGGIPTTFLVAGKL
jgi:C-methyltransferase